MFDGETESPILVFGDGTFPIPVSDYWSITTKLDEQADAIIELTQRVVNLESAGDAAGTPATTEPLAPTTSSEV